jgi:hypothetical protein
MKRIVTWSVFSTLALLGSSCGSSTTGNTIPLVEPPVSAATPSGLSGSRRSRALNVSEIQTRFFSAGPTKIQTLMSSIDSRISEINTRIGQSTRACLSNTAVAQNFTIFGETVTGYFQCYDLFSATAGMMFGKKDGVWYLYQNGGAARSFASVREVTGQTGKYIVEAYVSVGQGNSTDSTSCGSSWFGCSYGVIHLKANSADSTFEMTVAGTGMGFCGAQLRSDGTNLYVNGSTGNYNGSWSCASADTNCVLAANSGSAGSCATADDFTLTSLGITGQSTFGTGVTANGSDTDSVHFGTSVANMSTISGVTAF